MATAADGRTAPALVRYLGPLCVVSGAVVAAGFFFPTFVGGAVTGEAWLVVSLVFFGSGLGYLAALPYGDRGTADPDRPPLVVRLRYLDRGDVVDALAGFLARQDPVVLVAPTATFAAYFLLQAAAPAATNAAVDAVSGTILRAGGPLFQGAVLLAAGYCAFLLLGPWGDVRLGDDDPAYTYPTYFALVFTAGIAAGLVFWGPAEALFHYQSPPPAFGVAPESAAAVDAALVQTTFHWGVSAWSAYAAVAVPVAYFVFERGAPLRVSTVLAPFLGVEGLDSPWCRLVDTLAVFATVGGVATSVALVGEQFLVGIGYRWDVAVGALGPVVFVGGLTLIYVLSAASGVRRGVRRIAALTVCLFAAVALVLVAVGPRGFLLQAGTRALGGYAAAFLPLSVAGGSEWVAEWTVWNWSWWFSWAPFAGLFVAALSRGRTIRTVVFTSVVATAAATVVWFLLLGGTAIWAQRTGTADVLGAVAARGGSEAVAGFPLFDALPLGEVLLFAFLGLIVAFMVTSADTSTLVVSILASRPGNAPTTATVALWGALQGLVATAVLTVGGAETLQALAVLTGGPFAVVSVVALAGLTRTLYRAERGRGHASVPRRALARLPDLQLHHDVEPPGLDPGTGRGSGSGSGAEAETDVDDDAGSGSNPGSGTD